MDNVYLPTPSDWRTWFKIADNLEVERYGNNSYAIPGKHIFALTVAGVRQILEPIPFTAQELVSEEFSSTFLSLGFSPSKDPKVMQWFLQGMTKRLKYMKAVSHTDWQNKGYTSDKQPIHGRTKLYPITSKGTLAYEMILTFPYLAASIGNQNILEVTEANMQKFSFSLGILMRKNRIQWNPKFLEINNIPSTKHIDEVLKGQHEILGRNYDLFWKMASPITLLLREYAFLIDLISYYKDQVEIVEEAFESAKKSASPKSRTFLISTKPNLSITYQIMSEVALSYVQTLIVPAWQKLGLNKSDLEKHAPDADPFY